jgi:hypothetical protein
LTPIDVIDDECFAPERKTDFETLLWRSLMSAVAVMCGVAKNAKIISALTRPWPRALVRHV